MVRPCQALDSVVHVPLIIRAPDVRAVVSSTASFALIDIMPTVLELSGMGDHPAMSRGATVTPRPARHQR